MNKNVNKWHWKVFKYNQCVKLCAYTFEIVKGFKYLSTFYIEIEERIVNENRAYCTVLPILNNWILPRN